LRNVTRFSLRRDADRVRPRHAGVFDLLHDHEPGIRLGMRGRQDEVAVRRRISARFPQHALAQTVGMIAQVAHLVVHRLARHIEHASHDHSAMLAAGVRVDGVHEVRDAHQAWDSS
jgi:hypothetical protein